MLGAISYSGREFESPQVHHRGFGMASNFHSFLRHLLRNGAVISAHEKSDKLLIFMGN